MVGIHATTSLYSSILDMPPNKSLVRMIQAGSAAVQKNIILVLMVLKGSMPFCVELDNLKDTDAPIHQPAAMLVAAD